MEQAPKVDGTSSGTSALDGGLGVLRNLSDTLINENGGAFGFVCIWRKGDHSDSARTCSVGEWLSRPENQSGTWLIDGGWGGPPGPLHVRWDAAQQAWESGGFCGHRFETPNAELRGGPLAARPA